MLEGDFANRGDDTAKAIRQLLLVVRIHRIHVGAQFGVQHPREPLVGAPVNYAEVDGVDHLEEIATAVPLPSDHTHQRHGARPPTVLSRRPDRKSTPINYSHASTTT